MKSINSTILALVCTLVVATGILFPVDLLAQLPSATTVTGTMQPWASGWISLGRVLLGVACIIMAIFEAFKAAKGQSKQWIVAILLLLVGMFALSPSGILTMIGLGNACDANVKAWGAC